MKKDISDDVKTVYIGSDDDAKTVYIGDSEKTVYVGDSEKTVYVGDADEDDVITEVLGNIEPEKKRAEAGTEVRIAYFEPDAKKRGGAIRSAGSSFSAAVENAGTML